MLLLVNWSTSLWSWSYPFFRGCQHPFVVAQRDFKRSSSSLLSTALRHLILFASGPSSAFLCAVLTSFLAKNWLTDSVGKYFSVSNEWMRSWSQSTNCQAAVHRDGDLHTYMGFVRSKSSVLPIKLAKGSGSFIGWQTAVHISQNWRCWNIRQSLQIISHSRVVVRRWHGYFFKSSRGNWCSFCETKKERKSLRP